MSPMVILGILLAISVAGNGLLAKLYVGAKEDLAAETQRFKSFKAQVQVEGEKAEKEAKERTAAELKSKETADAENARTVAANARTIAELRHQRDSARSAFLSAAPTGSKCADNQACFDRAEYVRAHGELVKSLRGFADEGTAVTTDLDTAKRWATVR